MISMQRVWAIVYRHLRQVLKDIPRLTMLFYWSFIELVLIGFMAVWMQPSADASMVLPLIAAAIAWSLIVRPSLEVPWNILEELWSHNLVNLFASPLSVTEWMMSAAIVSALSFSALFVFMWILAYVIFGYNILSVGIILPLFLVNYYLSALAIGFLTAALLIRYGLRVTSYVFMVSWMFAPVSGIYYSLSVLPVWAQYTAHLLPTYYGINVLKVYVASGEIIYWHLFAAFGLNALYVCLTTILFKWMFEKSRQEGLGRLTSG